MLAPVLVSNSQERSSADSPLLRAKPLAAETRASFSAEERRPFLASARAAEARQLSKVSGAAAAAEAAAAAWGAVSPEGMRGDESRVTGAGRRSRVAAAAEGV